MSTHSEHPAGDPAREGGVSVVSHKRGSCFSLSRPEMAALLAWIEFAIEPAEEVEAVDSYRLRQDFQAMAFSVTNDTIKGAMSQAGYQPEDPEAECSRYRARFRRPRRVTT